jgi:hypothetical protein
MVTCAFRFALLHPASTITAPATADAAHYAPPLLLPATSATTSAAVGIVNGMAGVTQGHDQFENGCWLSTFMAAAATLADCGADVLQRAISVGCACTDWLTHSPT